MALRDKLRIMVVDDMATSRGLITQALDTIGVRNVATAAGGQAAITLLAKSPAHLVISDYNMPGMDGLQLLSTLRANPQTARIGFLLITGESDAQIAEKGKRLGMNNMVTKPVDAPKLQRAIEAVVGRL